MAGNTQGVSSTGQYLSTLPGLIPITQSAIASYTLTGTTSATIIQTINIPPLASYGFGPDSELIIAVTWVCNSSANVKTLTCNFGASQTPWTDTQTTNSTNEWFFRVSCRNNSSAQFIGGSQNTNSSTNGSVQINLDFTQQQYLAFWGTLANAADALRIERYSVWLSNPAVPSSQRALYGQKTFWGCNAHYDDTTVGGGSVTPAQVVSCLQAMHSTVLRMTHEGPQSLPALIAMAKQLQGTGIQMYCCLDLGLNVGQTEAQSFTQGWSTALQVVSALKPYGVVMYECGNEMDTKNGINVAGDNGFFKTSFSNALWSTQRGLIAGAVAGVQSMGCLAASNATTIAGVGFLDMLWNGTAPDGTSGYEKVQWDITAFHNYQPYGPLTGVQQYSGGAWVNIYDYLWRAYNKPIMISEYNGSAAFTEAQNATWCTRVQNEMYSLRYKYNIMGAIIYELFGGDPWGMVSNASTATLSNPLGTTVAANCNSLADTGF
jgi:hypothetical protein